MAIRSPIVWLAMGSDIGAGVLCAVPPRPGLVAMTTGPGDDAPGASTL